MKYLYSHDYEGAYIPQAYLPEGRNYYQPGTQGLEARIKERLEHWRESRAFYELAAASYTPEVDSETLKLNKQLPISES